MHSLVCLSHDLHDLVPGAFHGRAGRMHRVRQPRGLEELLHFGNFLGYREGAGANLIGNVSGITTAGRGGK